MNALTINTLVKNKKTFEFKELSEFKKKFDNLPNELQLLVFSFDPTFITIFKANWNKVKSQFLKGAFYRKNLRQEGYVKDQQKLCRRYWLSLRPEFSLSFRYGHNISISSLTYKTEWNPKIKAAIVTFVYSNGRSLNKYTGKNPVSIWLRNIDKFEKAYPEFAKVYLPKKHRHLKVETQSDFYLKRKRKNEVKKRELKYLLKIGKS